MVTEDKTNIPLSPFFNSESLEPDDDVNDAPPRPFEALYETPVPPFLTKIYDLMEDPSMDHVISWSMRGDSFVVWDPTEFSKVVLPRNFKHNKFSSFVRQLNTYGFRKVDVDRWEFANQGFIKGQRHLLRNIQRRKPPPPVGKAALESEIEQLSKGMSLMMREVYELQKQQRATLELMEEVSMMLQEAETRQKQMVSFLREVLQNPTFIARLREKCITIPKTTTRRFGKHQALNQGTSLHYLQQELLNNDYYTVPSSGGGFSQNTRIEDEFSASESMWNMGSFGPDIFQSNYDLQQVTGGLSSDVWDLGASQSAGITTSSTKKQRTEATQLE